MLSLETISWQLPVFSSPLQRVVAWLREAPTTFLWAEQDRLVLWVPAFLGLGIFGYFNLAAEPARDALWFMLFASALLCIGIWWVRTFLAKVTLLALLLALSGFQLTYWRTHTLATPMLTKPFGPTRLEGVVENINLHPLCAGGTLILRLTRPLHTQRFKRGVPQHLKRVRLLSKRDLSAAQVGSTVHVFAKLNSLPGAVWPYGYDMRRAAYFEGIGAKGIILGDIQPLRPAPTNAWNTRLARLRHHLHEQLYKTLHSETAAFVAALLLGDTGGITPEVRQAFSKAGIAHLLAVSGLHMSLVAALAFFLCRSLLGLIPGLALRIATHKIAALMTLLLAFGYLHLSGMRIPAQRAFWMTAVVMAGIWIGRSAFTLRLVAGAATFILLVHPENLLSVSFQLSFAAVTALVAVFEKRHSKHTPHEAGVTTPWIAKTFKTALSLLGSTVVAGLATLPLTAAVFHQVPLGGNLMNLLAIPLTTLLIMPLSLLFVALLPLGGGFLVAPFLNHASSFLMATTKMVAALPYASMPLAAGCPWAVPVLTCGGLWCLLWQSRLRWAGIPIVFIGFIGLFWSHPPDLLIDGEGKVFALFDTRTRTLWTSSKRRGVFAQRCWAGLTAAKNVRTLPFTTLKNTPLPQDCPNLLCDEQSCMLKDSRGRLVVLAEDGERAPFADVCHVLLSLEPLGPASLSTSHIRLGRFEVWRHGSACVWLTGKAPRVVTALNISGHRPWTRYPRFMQRRARKR